MQKNDIGRIQIAFFTGSILTCLLLFAQEFLILLEENYLWYVWLNMFTTCICFVWFMYKYLRISHEFVQREGAFDWLISFLIGASGFASILTIHKPKIWFALMGSLFFFGMLKDLQIVISRFSHENNLKEVRVGHYERAAVEKLSIFGVLILVSFLANQEAMISEISAISGSVYTAVFILIFFAYSLERDEYNFGKLFSFFNY